MTFADLLSLIRCPKSKTELVLDDDSLVNTDPATRLRYPVKEQIPILIPEEATILSPGEWELVMGRHGRDHSSGANISTIGLATSETDCFQHVIDSDDVE